MVPLVDTARGPSLEKSKPPMAHEADPLSYLTLASPQPRKRPLPELTWGGQVPSAQPTSPPYELLGLTELRPPAMAQMLPQPLSKPDRPLSALPVYKEKATPPPSYADVVKKDPRPSSGANVVAWPRQSSSTSLAGSSTMSVRSTAWLRPPYSLQSATRASVSYSSSSYTYEGRVQTEEGRFHRVLPVTAHNAAQQRKMAEHARREAERMRLAAARQQHRRRNEPEPVLELVQRVAASIHDGASKAGKPEREAMRNIEQAPSRGKGMKTRRDSKPVGGRPPRRGRSGHGGSSGRGGLTPRSRTRPLPMQV
ncbi:hypothetical protein C8Q76DRAFT_206331 [Earliella scabrosa]|nr:hypothetical protein C8Q76DRAFT_206331 [Earliella scabrosa]